MRILGLGLGFVLLAVQPTFAQTTTAPAARDAQAVALAARALAALSGGISIADVTLTGTARTVAGSLDESGTATLQALATGSSRIDLRLSSGQSIEVCSVSANGISIGSWSGADAAVHAIPQHNLMADSTWFYPAFLIYRVLQDTTYTVSAPAAETHDGQLVQHIRVYRAVPVGTDPQVAAVAENLSRVDLYLSTTTLLPVAIDFDAHADTNASVNITIEVQFSNWQPSSGAMIPAHVQQFLNNGLALDLQITSATLNSGLSASSFSLQ